MTIDSGTGREDLAGVAWARAFARTSAGAEPSVHLAGDPARSPRSRADAAAAFGRWHDAGMAGSFADRERPWYLLLELARVETLAGNELPGMRENLAPDAMHFPGDPATRLYRAARAIFAGDCAAPVLDLFSTRRRWTWPARRAAEHPVDVAAVLQQAGCVLAHADAFAAAVAPLVHALASGARDVGGAVFAALRSASADTPGPDDGDGADTGGSAHEARHRAERLGYRVYSRAWDRVLPAEVGSSRGVEPAIDAASAAQSRRLARRLQRRLREVQLRRWSFDLEEGHLDSRRLASLCNPGGARAVFRQERDASASGARVTFLVDQSGSMRGRAWQLAVQAIDLAVQALEACAVACEVLGYTTRYGADDDNPVLDAWVLAGRPDAPGRLNALEHRVYKAASCPWRHGRRAFVGALGAGRGRENIDGEALDWAASRLARQPGRRKVLVVFSDGTPHDEATVRHNGRALLENHLRSVIQAIEASPIDLAAIGTGQGVGRFYRTALTLDRPEDVDRMLFDHLADLLVRSGRREAMP